MSEQKNIIGRRDETEAKGLPLLIFQRSGPLTEELLLEPARFGLGMLPVSCTAGECYAIGLRILLDGL